jgi:hypothetical protein
MLNQRDGTRDHEADIPTHVCVDGVMRGRGGWA